MPTTVTLHLNDDLLSRARQHAAARGTDVSGLVAAYLLSLPPPPEPEAPATAFLSGLLAGTSADLEAYRTGLVRRHLGGDAA